MSCVKVGGFAGVCFHVVKLGKGSVGGRVLFRWIRPAAGGFGEAELPFAEAVGEVSGEGVVHDAGSGGLDWFADEGREEAHAVFASVLRKGYAGEFGAGGDEVVEHDGLLADGAGLYFRRPADDVRNAVAAFPDVGLGAAEMGADGVARFFELLESAPFRKAVIARDDDDRVLGEALFFERVEHFADDRVGMHHEIRVAANAAFAFPFRSGDDGSMRRGEGDVGEEGGRGVLLLDVVDGLLGEDGQGVYGFEVFRGRAFAVEAFDGGAFADESVVLHVDVRGDVEGGGDAVEVVEAEVDGASGDASVPVDIGEAFGGEFLVVDGGEAEAEVPFADAGGVVAGLLEEVGYGEAVLFDERLVEAH